MNVAEKREKEIELVSKIMSITKIKLKNSDDFAIVDAEDFERVKSFNWWVGKNKKGSVFVYRWCKNKRKYLSHLILGYVNFDQRVRIRFINGNRFDFRKSNLTGSGLTDASFPSGKKYSIYYFKPDPNSRSPWRVGVYLPFKQREVSLGSYFSKEYAEKIIEYLRETDITISSNDELKNIRSELRGYAIENGYGSLFSQGSGISGGRSSPYKIGDETVRSGTIFVKLKEGWRGWRLKHIVAWEAHNGRIPKSHHINFRDGDKSNCSIENLELKPTVGFMPNPESKFFSIKVSDFVQSNGIGNAGTLHLVGVDALKSYLSKTYDLGRFRLTYKEKQNAFVILKYFARGKEKQFQTLLHRFIFQQHYGEISPDTFVVFKDFNTFNFTIENLIPLSRAEAHMYTGLYNPPSELLPTVENLLDLRKAIYDSRLKKKNNSIQTITAETVRK